LPNGSSNLIFGDGSDDPQQACLDAFLGQQKVWLFWLCPHEEIKSAEVKSSK
jgi:hypothetical protein